MSGPPSARRNLPLLAGDDVGMRPPFRGEIHESLSSGAEPWLVAAAAAQAFDRLAIDLAQIAHGGGEPPACRAGCSSCCHQRVDLTAPEVIALALWLTAEHDAAWCAALRDRTREAAAAVAGLDAHAHWRARVRCPLLGDDGLCQGYEARPIACRRAHSTSVAACERAFARASNDIIPFNPSHQENNRLAMVGYFEGFAAAGRPLATYELVQALRIALEDPARLAADWRDGGDPFGPAMTHDAAAIELTFGGRRVPADDG